MLKESNYQPKILCPTKMSIRSEDKIKSTFRQKVNIHYLKLTQYCKSTMLQFKNLKKKNYLRRKKIISDESTVTQERLKNTRKRKCE